MSENTDIMNAVRIYMVFIIICRIDFGLALSKISDEQVTNLYN
ncbi:hypothetical protein L21_1424 [Methanoculleus chikugoensis]|uniref:Uncharacterized protein n=1 Tax=Methanoculleus chikugoensis TaxID=118126 RepID=A0A1M4ML18_9EURY|nr:hypothetical protein L21_1424 [Methanoculleus chikugoensis]